MYEKRISNALLVFALAKKQKETKLIKLYRKLTLN